MSTTPASTLFTTTAPAPGSVEWASIANKPGFHVVATTGDYDDLKDKPALGTAAARNVGTAPGNVIEVGTDGKLPASDGSRLTNVAAVTAAVATVANGVAPGSVTNVGLANMPPTTVKGVIIGGVPLDLTPAELRTVIGSDQPGNITQFMRADGALAAIPTAAIAPNTITDAQLVDMPANTVKGALVNGDPLNLTPAQLRSLIGSDNTTNTTQFLRADGQVATVPSTATGPGAGSITQVELRDGAVTTPKLADGAVTNAKAADMAAYTQKMRNDAATGDAQDVNIKDVALLTTPAPTRLIWTHDATTGKPEPSTLAATGLGILRVDLSHRSAVGALTHRTYTTVAAVPATWRAAFPTSVSATAVINKTAWEVRYDSNAGQMGFYLRQYLNDETPPSDGGGFGTP